MDTTSFIQDLAVILTAAGAVSALCTRAGWPKVIGYILAGAVIGNNVGDGNAGRGAAIGAVVGGVAGAVRGSQQDRQSHNLSRQYDNRYGRYYYCYPEGDCYWEDGTRRN